jgi:hypothetical protein
VVDVPAEDSLGHDDLPSDCLTDVCDDERTLRRHFARRCFSHQHRGDPQRPFPGR